MAHQERRIRVCKLLGGSGVAEGRDDDGNLRSVQALAGDDLLHGVVPGPAAIPLALDRSAGAAQLGDDVDALVALAADVPDAPAGAAEHLGAVALVLDRAHVPD